MSAVNWVAISKAARAAAAESIASCRRAHPGAHFVHRQVEILAIDADGERIGDQLDFLLLKELSGKTLAQVVRDHAPAQYDHIVVQGGIDAYDSLRDCLEEADYDPMVDCWEVSTLDDLPTPSERVPLDQCNAPRPGAGVSARIEASDYHRRAREATANLDRSAAIILNSFRVTLD